MAENPVVRKETLLHRGRFVVFKELEWLDPYGAVRTWESAERANNNGAVLIISALAYAIEQCDCFRVWPV